MSKIIKATIDDQNQVHYQGQSLLHGTYNVLITILDEPEDEAVYSTLNPVLLENMNPERLKQVIKSIIHPCNLVLNQYIRANPPIYPHHTI